MSKKIVIQHAVVWNCFKVQWFNDGKTKFAWKIHSNRLGIPSYLSFNQYKFIFSSVLGFLRLDLLETFEFYLTTTIFLLLFLLDFFCFFLLLLFFVFYFDDCGMFFGIKVKICMLKEFVILVIERMFTKWIIIFLLIIWLFNNFV